MAREDDPLYEKKAEDIETDESDHADEPRFENLASHAVVYLIALSLGSQAINHVAAQYLLKDDLKQGPAEAAFYIGFQSLGWVVKPVWGIITDSFPMCGQRRKPYLVLMSGVGALAFMSYNAVQTVWDFVLVLVITNSCMAFLSVIAQALMVQLSCDKDMSAASFNFTTYFGVKTISHACCTYGTGWLLERETPRLVLSTGACLFVLNLIIAPFMSEPPPPIIPSVRRQCNVIAELFQERQVWSVTMYIFVVCCMPTPTAAMFFFNVDVLGFNPEFIGTIALVGSLATITGLGFYHQFLTHCSLTRLFAGASVLLAVISLTPLIQVFRLNRQYGIDDRVFALVDTFFIAAVAEVLWIPMLVLCSRLCPPSVEGTTYALFLSIHNFGLWVSGVLSWGLMHKLGITRDNLSNLWIFILCCAICEMVPLLLLPWLPSEDPEMLRGDVEGRVPRTPAASFSAAPLSGRRSSNPPSLIAPTVTARRSGNPQDVP